MMIGMDEAWRNWLERTDCGYGGLLASIGARTSMLPIHMMIKGNLHGNDGLQGMVWHSRSLWRFMSFSILIPLRLVKAFAEGFGRISSHAGGLLNTQRRPSYCSSVINHYYCLFALVVA